LQAAVVVVTQVLEQVVLELQLDLQKHHQSP
jgi:hypothetical protein